MNTNLLKTFFVALFLITATGASAHDFYVGGIYYNITDATAKTVEVTYKGGIYSEYDNEYTDSVVIPSMVTYNNVAYSVTSIGFAAFSRCDSLTSVEIPNSITGIGADAFSGCTGLKEVHISDLAAWCKLDFSYYSNPLYYAHNLYLNGEKVTNLVIPDGVTEIKIRAFILCSGLTSITIPNSVTSIGYGAFCGCTGLTGLTIPNSVTSIGESAFEGCSGLTSITIPNSVTSIGERAFILCTGLTGVTIGNSVTSIGENAFEYCDGLKIVCNSSSLEITAGSSSYGYIAYYADKVINAPSSIEGDYVFSVVDGVNTLCGYIGNGGEITLPADYKGENYVIGADVFKNNTALIGVTIPNSVTSIGNYAFYGCSGLTGELIIPNSVTSIGSSAFYVCTGLTGELTIPNSVTSIGAWAFRYCIGLTSITIPNSVTSIGDYAFYDCTSLKTVYNFSSLELTKGSTGNGSVAYYADKVINAPNGSVEGDYVFGVVDGVNTLCGYIGNGGEITLPADYKGENYVIGADVFKNNTALTGITIPNSVTSIGDYAFDGCSGLISITIPNSVTSIGSDAFSDCCRLTSITIPNSVTSIGERAFIFCTGLTGVTIGNSVTSIGDYAFYDCTSLKTVYNFSSLELTKGSTGNGSVAYYADKVINAPNGSVEGDYVFSVVDGVNTLCGYIGNGGEITLPADYKGENYVIGADVFKNNTALTRVTIPNSVTSIGDYAFSGCSALTGELIIPNSVTSIGSSAFYVCTGLTGELTIPNSVTSIGDYAFGWCTGLTGELIIPNSVTSIGNYAFCDCSGLTGELIIPNSVTSVGDNAFRYCTGLTGVTIGNSVTSIGDYAFYDCTSLKTVYNFSSLELTKGSTNNGYVAYYADKVINAPNGSVEGDYVFSVVDGVNTLCGYIGNGEEITLPADYKGENYVIGADVFKNNTALIGVTIPNSVTSIGSGAFEGCTGLTNITIPNCVTTIGNSAFYGCSGLSRVTIGKNVKTIEDNAFSDCRNLSDVINASSLNIVKGSADNGYVGYYADLLINANDDLLEGDFVFGVIDGKNTLCGYIGNGGEITLPANYNGENYLIGKRAFYHRNDLVSITIPNSVTSIGYRVFDGCSNLKRIINFSSCYLNPFSYDCAVINLPNGSIEGDFVFGVIDGKNALCEYIGNDTEIVLPANYKGGDYIISSKFQGVTKITLPDFVKEIVHRQFQKCVDLNSIVMPDNITSIGAYAFQYCDLLSIHIPATVKEIGDYAFTWNLNLSSITVDKNNPVYYVPDGYKNIIMERATNKIVFACKGAVIPETATAIGNGAFNGVGGIESITIPAGITSIGDWAFDGCRDLKVIYALSETPVELPYNVFSNDAMSAITLYVPIGAKEAYATAWGFDNIVETDFTGVDGVTADEQTGGNELYYDLSGRAVKNPANGIYIYKGKKVLVQ